MCEKAAGEVLERQDSLYNHWPLRRVGFARAVIDSVNLPSSPAIPSSRSASIPVFFLNRSLFDVLEMRLVFSA
jgi:hypothetical protein